MTRRQGALLAGAAAAGMAVLGLNRRRRAMDLDGAIVTITGGSRGLGLLLARELSRRGARIVLAARNEPELLHTREDILRRGGLAAIGVADVATELGARRAIEETVAAFGPFSSQRSVRDSCGRVRRSMLLQGAQS